MTDAKALERHLSMAAAVEISGISESQLKRAIRATEGHMLKAKKNGRNYLIAESALAAYLAGLDDA